MWLIIIIAILALSSLIATCQDNKVEGYSNLLQTAYPTRYACATCMDNPEKFGRDRFAYDRENLCLYGPFEKKCGCTDCYGLADPRCLCYGKTKGAKEVACAAPVSVTSLPAKKSPYKCDCWARGRQCKKPYGLCGV